MKKSLLSLFMICLALEPLLLLMFGLLSLPEAPVHAAALNKPKLVLWAWRRDENLQFIDPQEFAVAYLACQAQLSGKELKVRWRREALKVPDKAELIPVLRIDQDLKEPAELSSQQLESTLQIVQALSRLKATRAVQIDFDARLSEREFYKKLIASAKARLPEGVSLSITSLASWCLFDRWTEGLPLDETVPMMFSLGNERAKILSYFAGGKDFLVSGCCKSLGISIDDPELTTLMIGLVKQRRIPVRIYVFTKTAWNRKKLNELRSILR